MRLVIVIAIPAVMIAIILTLAATWAPNGAESTMTAMDRVDLATFGVIVVAQAWQLWLARQDPVDEVRRLRLRSAAIFLWASVLPAEVYFERRSSLSAWFLVLAVLGGGGALLFYWAYRAD